MPTRFALAALALTPLAAHAASKQPAPADTDQGRGAARDFAVKILPQDCQKKEDIHIDDVKFSTAFPMTWTDPDGLRHHSTLYEIYCAAYVRDEGYSYVIKDEQGNFSVAAFATPVADYEYVEGDDTNTRLKAPPRVIGYTATNILENASYDAKSHTVSFGFHDIDGDASEWGDWIFDGRKFVLKDYFIDPIKEFNLETPSLKLREAHYQLFPPILAKLSKRPIATQR